MPVGTSFRRARDRANLPDMTPHTLRHTFASRLAMAGVDMRTLQELGGWHTLRMVQRYAHLAPSQKAHAVERIVIQTSLEPEKLVPTLQQIAPVVR